MGSSPDEIAADLKVQVAKSDEWMRQTTEYRAKLCQRFDRLEDKIDSMAEKLASIPCRVHIERMDGFDKRLDSHSGHIGKLWAAAGTIAMTVIGAFIAYAFKIQ